MSESRTRGIISSIQRTQITELQPGTDVNAWRLSAENAVRLAGAHYALYTSHESAQQLHVNEVLLALIRKSVAPHAGASLVAERATTAKEAWKHILDVIMPDTPRAETALWTELRAVSQGSESWETFAGHVMSVHAKILHFYQRRALVKMDDSVIINEDKAVSEISKARKLAEQQASATMPEQALIQILIAGTSDTRSLPRDTLLTLADTHHIARDLITAAIARERAAATTPHPRRQHEYSRDQIRTMLAVIDHKRSQQSATTKAPMTRVSVRQDLQNASPSARKDTATTRPTAGPSTLYKRVLAKQQEEQAASAMLPCELANEDYSDELIDEISEHLMMMPLKIDKTAQDEHPPIQNNEYLVGADTLAARAIWGVQSDFIARRTLPKPVILNAADAKMTCTEVGDIAIDIVGISGSTIPVVFTNVLVGANAAIRAIPITALRDRDGPNAGLPRVMTDGTMAMRLEGIEEDIPVIEVRETLFCVARKQRSKYATMQRALPAQPDPLLVCMPAITRRAAAQSKAAQANAPTDEANLTHEVQLDPTTSPRQSTLLPSARIDELIDSVTGQSPHAPAITQSPVFMPLDSAIENISLPPDASQMTFQARIHHLECRTPSAAKYPSYHATRSQPWRLLMSSKPLSNAGHICETLRNAEHDHSLKKPTGNDVYADRHRGIHETLVMYLIILNAPSSIARSIECTSIHHHQEKAKCTRCTNPSTRSSITATCSRARHTQHGPTKIFCDAKVVADVIIKDGPHQRLAHVGAKVVRVRETQRDGIIEIEQVPRELQLADILGKPRGPSEFTPMRDVIVPPAGVLTDAQITHRLRYPHMHATDLARSIRVQGGLWREG
ncbi:hypothetical protein RI054_03g16470 [Pseudoscourfieldia marina]